MDGHCSIQLTVLLEYIDLLSGSWMGMCALATPLLDLGHIGTSKVTKANIFNCSAYDKGQYQSWPEDV